MTSQIPQKCKMPLIPRNRKIPRTILNFASDYDGLSDTTEVRRVEESEFSADDGVGYIYTDWPTSESSDYNGPSETTDTYPAEESETLPDELALDTYSTPITSNKRREGIAPRDKFG
ncbi:hypothetical protein DL98DRAFT_598329 [Cadophora sp. DSE1049]|nr:hypothetical protein DL98DRAFT_598329 [Cadophora sp. DSE1049]